MRLVHCVAARKKGLCYRKYKQGNRCGHKSLVKGQELNYKECCKNNTEGGWADGTEKGRHRCKPCKKRVKSSKRPATKTATKKNEKATKKPQAQEQVNSLFVDVCTRCVLCNTLPFTRQLLYWILAWVLVKFGVDRSGSTNEWIRNQIVETFAVRPAFLQEGEICFQLMRMVARVVYTRAPWWYKKIKNIYISKNISI